MEKEAFRLSRFKLENKSVIEATFKTDGKVITEEFTAAVSNDLYEAFVAFDAVFVEMTGLNPSVKNSKVEDVSIRTIHLFDGADERQLMLTEIIKWKGGYANSMNTPKQPLSAITANTKIDVEQLVDILVDEVYELLFNKKLGHEQPTLM